MKKVIITTIIMLLFAGCTVCDDCLDLQEKEIVVQDSQGNNLLFGANAIFDPESIVVTSNENNTKPVFVYETSKVIVFTLEKDVTSYDIKLGEEVTQSLAFELGERKSERCCGNQVYSTATWLNDITVPNTNRIIMVVD